MNKGHGNLSCGTCESSCILKSRWFAVGWEGKYAVLHLVDNPIKNCHFTGNRVQTIQS